MKNVLIVGGAGYVGGAVTDALKDSAHNIKVYDSLVYEDRYMKDVPFVRGDVRDREKLQKELNWADTVIWLAAVVGDGACALNPQQTIEVNEKSAGWLCEHFDGRIVFTSTCSVYGIGKGILTEDSPVNPLSLYAGTKLYAERFLSKRDALIFRLGTLFGISDRFSRIRFDLVVNILTMRAVLEKHLTVFGGEQCRPLLHVRDIGRMIEKSVDLDVTGIFNLHQSNLKIIDLAHKIKAKVSDCEITITPTKFEDTRNYKVSSDKAKKILGFSPQLTVDDGISEIRDLVVSNRIKDPNHYLYSNQTFLKRQWKK